MKGRENTRLVEIRTGKGPHTLADSDSDSGLLPFVCFTFTISLDEQKAKGDVKKKGRLDPYAYIPLNRTKLNRRYGDVA